MSTGIEWTDETWNPVVGCTRVSPGCQHCYAERMAKRLSKNPSTPQYAGTVDDNGRWTGQVNLVESALLKPLSWRKPRMVFVNSMSDLFHESVPDEYIDKVFAVMAQAHHHTYQVLTKRPERITEWAAGAHLRMTRCFRNFHDYTESVGPWPLPNVWLGTSAENQATLDERLPHLLATPAAVRFLSLEPLLGPIDVRGRLDGIDWVIVGGESGPGAQPMHPDWVRSIRDACVEAEVAFFFKQWGEWLPQSVANSERAARYAAWDAARDAAMVNQYKKQTRLLFDVLNGRVDIVKRAQRKLATPDAK